jgi:hypothetical protein
MSRGEVYSWHIVGLSERAGEDEELSVTRGGRGTCDTWEGKRLGVTPDKGRGSV